MQSVSSRIWTRIAVFISYGDNDYTTGTSTKRLLVITFLNTIYAEKKTTLVIVSALHKVRDKKHLAILEAIAITLFRPNLCR